MTPPWMGFGNQLYLWVWAHAHQHEPVRPLVLMTDAMRYWADLVPAFKTAFIVEPTHLRRLDRRETHWAFPGSHCVDPRGFTDEQRTAFIRDWIRPSPLGEGIGMGPLAEPDCVVVNVRRGDFYTGENRAKYGFDVESYVRLAVEGAVAADGPIKRVHLVSDDLAWCRRRLPWLTEFTRVITESDPHGGPARAFHDVASARRLVITNSTFSMWAAAVGNVVHGSNATSVWVPAFFDAGYGPGRCFEYDKAWSAVPTLPGGWQPQWMLDGLESGSL